MEFLTLALSEMDMKIEIKEEPVWMDETANTSLDTYVDNNVGNECIVKVESQCSVIPKLESEALDRGIRNDMMMPDIKEEITIEEHTDELTPSIKEESRCLLLLVIGCAQCIHDSEDDCSWPFCGIDLDKDGERFTTRMTLRNSVSGNGDEHAVGFTSYTVNARGTVVSQVNVTFNWPVKDPFQIRYGKHPKHYSWITKSPLFEDFWLGDYYSNDGYLRRAGVRRLSVHVYNMSLDQISVSTQEKLWLTELELTGSSWPTTSRLTLELSYLKKLSLADNRIESLYEGLLEDCRRLEELDLSRNQISSYLNIQFSLKPVSGTLKQLNLAGNIITECQDLLSDLGWHLKKLNLSYNQISSVTVYRIPKNRELDVSFNNNNITNFHVYRYKFRVDRVVLAGQNISSLSEVGTILYNIDEEMFGFSIRNVELGYDNTFFVLQSQCTVDRKYIYCLENDPNMFRRGESAFMNFKGNPIKIPKSSALEICPENFLDLSGNNLKALEDVPARMSGTKHLDLSRNSIGYISRHVFENMTRLAVLDLSYNQLKHVELILYSSLFMLDISNNNLNRTNISHSSSQLTTQYLNLSHNSFTNILKAEWSQFDQFSNVDLGGNNFECCSPEGQYSRTRFLIYQHKILNINSSRALTCVRPFYGRVDMTDAWLSEDHCQFNVQGWVGFGCLVLLLPLIIHGVDLIDYFMHQTERDLAEQLTRLKNQGLEQDENCALECQYDAFVCHSHKDARWVRYELVPNLENDRDGHRLCIHYRDFELGSFIEDNVEKAMNSSRKVIVVVTRSFLQSNWCKMELTFAWEKMVREGRNYIIVIEVDRIPKDKRPPILSYLMRSRTYLEWPEAPTEDEKQQCWSRVRDALGKSLRDRQQESGIAAFQMGC